MVTKEKTYQAEEILDMFAAVAPYLNHVSFGDVVSQLSKTVSTLPMLLPSPLTWVIKPAIL